MTKTNTTNKVLYLANLLPHNLTVKPDMQIPPGGYKIISKLDEDDEYVNYAIARGWALITDEKPDPDNVNSPVQITVHEPYQGISEADLKKEKAEKQATKNGVTSTAIGKPESEAETKAAAEAKTK